MSKPTLLASVGASVVLAVATSSVAFAWHPKGVIVKQVQNQTQGGSLEDANSASAAVSAKQGDVLRYVITVSNDGAQADQNYNDMAGTLITDTLPAGVELVSNPSLRTISENVGTIKPQQKVVKEYTVKVTATTTDGQLIENKACFTGNSTANDNPQQGCDMADVKVSVPKAPEKPVAQPVKSAEQPAAQPAAQQQPVQASETSGDSLAALPSTGPESMIGSLTGISALTFAAVSYLRSRRQ